MDSSDPPSALSLRSHSVSVRCGMGSPSCGLQVDGCGHPVVTFLVGRRQPPSRHCHLSISTAHQSSDWQTGLSSPFLGGYLSAWCCKYLTNFQMISLLLTAAVLENHFPPLWEFVSLSPSYPFLFFQMKEMERNTRKEGIVCLQTSFFTDFFTEAATF